MIGAGDRRSTALELAARWLGAPYRWGGSSPLEGFDCSGLVVEVLKSVGVLQAGEDATAESLRHRFPPSVPSLGCLVTYGDPATHIVIVAARSIDGRLSCIEASGGDHTTVDLAAAIQAGAFVKWRPLRSGWSACVDPF